MFDTILESFGGLGGWAVALGAAVVAGPTVARVLRPAAKSAIKGYLTIKDRAATATQETRENLQDLVAEARAEHQANVQNPTV